MRRLPRSSWRTCKPRWLSQDRHLLLPRCGVIAMGVRRQSREAALQMLCQADALAIDAEQSIRLFWGSLAPESEARPFADELVRGWYSVREQIDQHLRNVSQNWRLERMSRVDRNVLRLATYELLHVPDVPSRVALNEAVELAKRFSADGSASFVNGVLDRIASEIEGA